MKIFLLEDTEYVAEPLIQRLEEDGHKVEWVLGVDTGRIALRLDDFDFGILDYNVIGGHGTDLLPDIEGRFEAVMFTSLPEVVQGYGVPVFDKLHPEAMLEYVDAVAARIDAEVTE